MRFLGPTKTQNSGAPQSYKMIAMMWMVAANQGKTTSTCRWSNPARRMQQSLKCTASAQVVCSCLHAGTARGGSPEISSSLRGQGGGMTPLGFISHLVPSIKSFFARSTDLLGPVFSTLAAAAGAAADPSPTAADMKESPSIDEDDGLLSTIWIMTPPSPTVPLLVWCFCGNLTAQATAVVISQSLPPSDCPTLA